VKERTFDEGAIVLGCGERSIRFRSPLTITEDDIDEGIACIRRAASTVAREHKAGGDGAPAHV
jgi:L-lysine 6-transaminase